VRATEREPLERSSISTARFARPSSRATSASRSQAWTPIATTTSSTRLAVTVAGRPGRGSSQSPSSRSSQNRRRHFPTVFAETPTASATSRCRVRLIADNYGTDKSPAMIRWLEQRPRLHMHYTPTYSSWINQVARWFAYLTDDLLRRSDHRSVQALEKDIREWGIAWDENPKPFIWTKSAEQILESISRLLKRINGAGH
jgi:transposase